LNKICAVIGSRANYASIKTALIAIKKNKKLKLKIVAIASSVLERYGNVSEIMIKDGLKPDYYVHSLIEGETPKTMAMSTGLGLLELPDLFDRIKPHCVLTVGDRYETMSTVIAASYMNICIAHTMGGEVTGTIDESIRHAITKFSHIHFPSNKDSAKRIIKLGENKKNVYVVGCPRIDLVKKILQEKRPSFVNLYKTGVGKKVNINKPFILLSQHPVTTEFGDEEINILESLEAIKKTKIPAIVLWPNSDAGSNDISRGIRKWREKNSNENFYYFKNLDSRDYIHLMNLTKCLVGNSSSGIREGAFIGTPVVNIGSRQESRLMGQNVISVPSNRKKIYIALQKQLKNGKYRSNSLYGNGTAGEKISNILSKPYPDIQKKITY
tara:strand:- start:2434 stop:3582 length:1149 start_codon:yes stop_codon:yes gene_type:complete